jgi:hypothetical protein
LKDILGAFVKNTEHLCPPKKRETQRFEFWLTQL